MDFSELEAHVAKYSLEYAEQVSGVDRDSIERAADTIGRASATSLWWTMGVNQSYEGVRTAQAIINIALITGNIGRPGTGANSITGQCNAMGSRLWSNTTNLFGHHRFEDRAHREKVAQRLGIDVEHIPSEGSWSYDRIIEGIREGSIRGLWVVATNPSHSWIHQGDVRELLEQLDFFVVQDMYSTTESAQQADLLLPAAGWGEKEGTFINSERRYGLHRKVRQAPGEALADFQIFRAIAHYWGVREMFKDWTSPEAVFEIMQSVSEGQPSDITGIEGYAHIDRCGGIQWPWSREQAAESLQLNQKNEPEQERRLFADAKFYHSDERARLIVAEPGKMPEVPNEEYPLILLTGRGTVSQWHTQTRTEKSPILRKLYPNDPIVEVHPDDADGCGISNGEWVEIASRRGSAVARAWLTPTVRAGQVFMPMHYECTNRLTLPHFDPYSRQPSYKNCAVNVKASTEPRTV